MKRSERYDAVILGAGQAGVPLSTTLAKAGWKTALVEAGEVGGTCVNIGCTPSKTMIASARVAYLARRAAEYGVHTGPVSVNMAEVRERKRRVVEYFRQGRKRRIQGPEGVDLLPGEASFVDRSTVAVRLNGDRPRYLTAERVFINAGARPVSPPIPGLDQVSHLDSTSIMDLVEVPSHLLVLGGGYIGLEFAQMFRRFGSAVTVLERGPQLLPHEDADVAQAITDILHEDGVEVLLGAAVTGVARDGRGEIRLSVHTPAGERTSVGSHLLVAVGRVPNSDRLNLPAAGVATDARGYVRVNEKLETNVPGIYALGEINGGPAFTHVSYDDYRVMRTNLLEGGRATVCSRLTPYVMFLDPHLGRVGLTEKEARAQGRRIRVARLPMSQVARAVETGETRGLLKAVVDADSGLILGAAVLSVDGGEIVAILQMAMLGHLPYTALREGVFAHPTVAEALNDLFLHLTD